MPRFLSKHPKMSIIFSFKIFAVTTCYNCYLARCYRWMLKKQCHVNLWQVPFLLGFYYIGKFSCASSCHIGKLHGSLVFARFRFLGGCSITRIIEQYAPSEDPFWLLLVYQYLLLSEHILNVILMYYASNARKGVTWGFLQPAISIRTRHIISCDRWWLCTCVV